MSLAGAKSRDRHAENHRVPSPRFLLRSRFWCSLLGFSTPPQAQVWELTERSLAAAKSRDRHAEIRRVPSPRFLLLLRLYATFEGVAQQPRIRFFIIAAVIVLFAFALCYMCLNIRAVNQ